MMIVSMEAVLPNVSVVVTGIPENSVGDSSETEPIITETAMFYLTIIPWNVVAQALCVFGVVTNTINMIVFVKSRFKDSINISLFALAISDFGACFSLIFSTIALNPGLQSLDLPVLWGELQYITSGYPHIVFAKITTVITAFITFERCLCVTLPLKVKTILTRKRVVAYLITCYFIVIAIYSPIFYSNQLGTKYSEFLNKTVIGIKYLKNRKAIEEVIYPIQYSLLSVFAFVFIIFSTGLLVVKLNEKTKWRLKATSKKEESNEGETKEQRISKMVIAISALFIACFLPTAALQLAMQIEPRININGVFYRLNLVLAYFSFNLELMNSSVNIFIYYRNSSNYKAVFDKVILRRPVNKDISATAT